MTCYDETLKPDRFQVFHDRGAGEAHVHDMTDGGEAPEGPHDHEVARCATEAEVEVELELLRGTPVCAVFYNRPEGSAFWSWEHGLSGNWRGSKYGHSDLVRECKTEEEAEAMVARLTRK